MAIVSGKNQHNGTLRHVKTFSFLHFLTLTIMLACAYCIVVLFQEVRHLEHLLKRNEKSSFHDTSKRVTKRETGSLEHGSKRYSLLDYRSNMQGGKMTFLSKESQEALLKKARDSASSMLIPSVTRIDIATLEEYCLSTRKYCDGKSQTKKIVRPITPKPSAASGTVTKEPRPTTTKKNSVNDQQQENSVSSDRFEEYNFPSKNGEREIFDKMSNRKYQKYAGVKNRVKPLNQTVTKRPKGSGKRKRPRIKCFVNSIGAASKTGQRTALSGSWMRDAAPRTPADAEKRWVVEHSSNPLLYEYASPENLRDSGTKSGAPMKSIELKYEVEGTHNLIYNGSFIYKMAGYPDIVRQDLSSGACMRISIKNAAYNNHEYLYRNNNSKSYYDISADENGIWVVYHRTNSRLLSIVRLHRKTMRIISPNFETGLDHTTIGETWITCGFMYAVKSAKDRRSTVTIAYDLFKHRYNRKLDMPWENQQGNTVMVSYNPDSTSLQIYDNGTLYERQLSLIFKKRRAVDEQRKRTKDKENDF